MKKGIFFSALCLFLLGPRVECDCENSTSCLITPDSTVKRSYYSHPDIKGFDFCYGYKDVA